MSGGQTPAQPLPVLPLSEVPGDGHEEGRYLTQRHLSSVVVLLHISVLMLEGVIKRQDICFRVSEQTAYVDVVES